MTETHFRTVALGDFPRSLSQGVDRVDRVDNLFYIIHLHWTPRVDTLDTAGQCH